MHRRITMFGALVLVALAGAAVAMGALGSGGRRHVVTTARNAHLGKTTLVTLSGRTLYSLSVERNSRFVCVKSCAALWPPLVVPKGVTPTGASSLGTVQRPDGRRQVTYKGAPLYSFSGDHARGDANGEGLKDVGTWHAAATGGGSGGSTTTSTTSTTTPTGGYGY